MRARPTTYDLGLEFYLRRDGLLDAVETTRDDGATSSYSGLTAEEAQDYLSCWLRGERWARP